MHFKPKGVLGIAVPVLLGGALAAGALALPAHAQSYQDTAVSAGTVTDEPLGVSGLGYTDGSRDFVLTGTGVSSWSLNSAPDGETITGSTISCSTCTIETSAKIVVDAKDSNGNAEALVISVVIAAANSIQATGTPASDTVTALIATDNSDGTVTFSAKSSLGITYGESNLPTGLTSANPLTYSGGTAVPGTYSGVKATATDTDGAVLNGTFVLTVDGNTVTTTNNGTYGDEVNQFSYGFDSYRQHDYAGAIIVGWTATSSDPATHFLMNSGSTSGYYQFEYAPSGSGSGLCVSDPGGGWGSDPLRDGLILANCNSGPFQQFLPQSDGTLVNLATGLIVNPAGKGGQLRGGSSAVGWGGSFYTWESGE